MTTVDHRLCTRHERDARSISATLGCPCIQCVQIALADAPRCLPAAVAAKAIEAAAKAMQVVVDAYIVERYERNNEYMRDSESFNIRIIRALAMLEAPNHPYGANAPREILAAYYDVVTGHLDLLPPGLKVFSKIDGCIVEVVRLWDDSMGSDEDRVYAVRLPVVGRLVERTRCNLEAVVD